jgi:hypothetical protein
VLRRAAVIGGTLSGAAALITSMIIPGDAMAYSTCGGTCLVPPPFMGVCSDYPAGTKVSVSSFPAEASCTGTVCTECALTGATSTTIIGGVAWCSGGCQ